MPTSRETTPQNQTRPFQYGKLSGPRCTRVIRLLPSGDKDARLALELVEMSVDQPVTYCALSYTWGGQPLDQVVTCHGLALSITANAQSALRRLRESSHAINVWVDAICINQTSVEEKDVQVPLMADIYSKANRVVVWLGEATTDIEKAFQFMHVIRRIGRKWSRLIYTWNIGASLARRTTVLKDKKACFESGIRQLSDDNAYWTRAWTVQELALNSVCDIYCGNSRPVPFKTFFKALSFVDAYLGPDAKEGSRNAHREYVQACITHYAPYLKLQNTDHDILLTALAEKQATNPRDLIYGNRAVYPEVFGQIPVSYGCDVETLFSQAAAAMIVTRNDIAPVLAYACERPKMDSLPSWVPDWSSMNESLKYPFPSPGHSEQTYRFSRDGLRMFIRGHVVDTSLEIISDRLDSFPTTELEQSAWHDRLRIKLVEWVSAQVPLMKMDDVEVDALLQRFPLNPHDVRASGLYCEAAICSLLGPTIWMEYHLVPWLHGQLHGMRDDQRRDTEREMRKFAGQRLFMTQQGYIGLCKEVEVGDSVVHFPGCPGFKRAVLRSGDGGFELVSEAEVREVYTQSSPEIGTETVEYCLV